MAGIGAVLAQVTQAGVARDRLNQRSLIARLGPTPNTIARMQMIQAQRRGSYSTCTLSLGARPAGVASAFDGRQRPMALPLTRSHRRVTSYRCIVRSLRCAVDSSCARSRYITFVTPRKIDLMGQLARFVGTRKPVREKFFLPFDDSCEQSG